MYGRLEERWGRSIAAFIGVGCGVNTVQILAGGHYPGGTELFMCWMCTDPFILASASILSM